MSAAAAAASLQAPSSSVVREVGKLEAVARMTMSCGSVGVAGGVKIESPSTASALSSNSQQNTRIPTNTGGAGTHHSSFNGTALSQLPPTNGTNPLQCLQQMTVIGPDVKPDMSGSQKLCSTSAANSNYPSLGFTEQWAAAFTQQLGGGNSGYFSNAFNVPTSTMFNYPVLAAGGAPPFIDPTTGRISGAWADLDPTKKGKGRQTYNRSQTHTLETTFTHNRYVTRKQRAELERQTGLTDRQIKIWFQNRRMKAKKDGHRQADEQGHQQPNSGSSSQQPLIAHPPTPTSSSQLNVPKTADVRANSTRNDGASLRHGNLTPPLSRGMDYATFGGYNCHLPSAYPHFSAFPAMETDSRPQKGVGFPASTSSMPTSNGQAWGQGCLDAWQMMNTMDSTALSIFQQQSLAALSTTSIGCYNGGGGGGCFQPNPPQACAPSGTSNPADYHQYTGNENR